MEPTLATTARTTGLPPTTASASPALLLLRPMMVLAISPTAAPPLAKAPGNSTLTYVRRIAPPWIPAVVPATTSAGHHALLLVTPSTLAKLLVKSLHEQPTPTDMFDTMNVRLVKETCHPSVLDLRATAPSPNAI